MTGKACIALALTVLLLGRCCCCGGIDINVTIGSPGAEEAYEEIRSQTGTQTQLTVYRSSNADDYNDWANIKDSIGSNTDVVICNADEVPSWEGERQAWIGEWQDDNTYLLYRGRISYSTFQSLVKQALVKEWILWSQ